MVATLRGRLNLPDTIEVQAAELQRVEAEAHAEIAEVRTVTLAGLTGARSEDVARVFAIEDAIEYRESYGDQEAQSAKYFTELLRHATVSDREIEEPRPVAQSNVPFEFRPAGAE